MEKYTEMNNDENFCRICLEEEDNINSLISPCRCSGSSKYVHIQCLQNWRRVLELKDLFMPLLKVCMVYQIPLMN